MQGTFSRALENGQLGYEWQILFIVLGIAKDRDAQACLYSWLCSLAVCICRKDRIAVLSTSGGLVAWFVHP